MINFLTVLFMVVGIIGILGLIAFSLCWAAHEAETMKDYEEVDNGNKTDDI